MTAGGIDYPVPIGIPINLFGFLLEFRLVYSGSDKDSDLMSQENIFCFRNSRDQNMD